MSASCKLLLFSASLLAAAWVQGASAEPKTVCTVTVNSQDEKAAFRRSLPPDEYRFVELVEPRRQDWLSSACAQRVACDILVISGHYDGRDEFYSDQAGASQFLPVYEMERASCSVSCSTLFSRLKEVYLFGCNTLNADALRRLSAEAERSLIRSGHSPADAERLSRALSALHAESSRDRMRLIFDGVPVIYGFSAKAPVGPVAASLLDDYFRSGGGVEIGAGRASNKLLRHFASTSMTVANGLTAREPLSDLRRDVCRFADNGLTLAQRLDFVHQVLQREMAEVRAFLDRIEKTVGSVSDGDRVSPSVRRVLAEIARDGTARSQFLAFARDADQPAVRARMIKLARALSWLPSDDERSELVALIRDRLAANSSAADVELVCGLNDAHQLDSAMRSLAESVPSPRTLGQAALLACLGSVEDRVLVLSALTSAKATESEMAQVYLRHRRLDPQELSSVTDDIAKVSDARVQARALDALACQHISDPDSLEGLARLFSTAQTPGVQAAIAGVLLRSDYQAIARPEVVQSLRESRLPNADCPPAVDALIRRLEAP